MTTIPIPAELVERAIALGERDVAATEALGDKIDEYHREVKPALLSYAELLRGLEAARNTTIVARTEGRGRLERTLTSRKAVAAYSVILSAVLTLLANYLLGVAGIAPAPVRASLATEAAHAVAE